MAKIDEELTAARAAVDEQMQLWAGRGVLCLELLPEREDWANGMGCIESKPAVYARPSQYGPPGLYLDIKLMPVPEDCCGHSPAHHYYNEHPLRSGPDLSRGCPICEYENALAKKE